MYIHSDCSIRMTDLLFILSSFDFFQSYIHGSSQAQFVAESHIILLLSILQMLMTEAWQDSVRIHS